VAGIYSVIADLFLRDRDRLTRRVNEEVRRSQRDNIQRSPLFKNLGQAAESDDVEDLSWSFRFRTMVEQSGLKLTPDRLVFYMIAVGLGLAGLIFLVQRQPISAVIAGIIGCAIPFFYVLAKRNARLHKLLGQLPDAFDLMARIIRSGQTMSQAIQT